MVRFKVRYLLARLIWDDGRVDPGLSAAALQTLVKREVRDKFGDYGSATCTHTIHIKYFNNITGLVIIRCPRSSYRIVWATLSLIQFIDQRRMRLAMIYVAGTIRSCQKHAIKFHTDAIRDEKVAARLSASNTTAEIMELEH